MHTQQKWVPFSEEVEGALGALPVPISSRVRQEGADTPPKVGAPGPGVGTPHGS